MGGFGFRILGVDGGARRGRLTTARGEVDTPAFMPVGTAGTVKGVTPEELRACGADIVLCNTYHLYLRPGHDVVARLGGLHRFMHWDGPILTDSGGFQAFSMAELRELDDRGVTFRSHLDGSEHRLTPAKSMEIQAALGSDVAMVLDECPALPAPREAVAKAVDRTTRWARECRERYRGRGAVFAIVQGGIWPDLREKSASQLVELDFPGYAVGGTNVGEPREEITRIAGLTARMLPEDRPRYLMGIGRPEDLVEAVAVGLDMFDCVMPTRNARNGTLFTARGRINIKQHRYLDDPRPVDETCRCPACRHYSRAYLRHLFLSREILGSRLNTLHNLTYYLDLLSRLRDAIAEDRFETFRREFHAARTEEASC
jgi:queuine tRNA-ribosyltransferase